MRIRLLICMITVCMLLLCSCGAKIDSEVDRADGNQNMAEDESGTEEVTKNPFSGFLPNADPDPALEDVNFYVQDPSCSVECEQEYNNFKVEMAEKEYKIGTDMLTCEVTNMNPGKGFYAYKVPYIEYKNNGQWERLPHYPISLRVDLYQYFWIYYMDAQKEYQGYTFKIHTQDIMAEIVPGDYRVLIFIGPEKYYAEFSFVE